MKCWVGWRVKWAEWLDLHEMMARYDSVPAQTITPLTSLAISVVLAFSVIA
jgi:hypothetical protein